MNAQPRIALVVGAGPGLGAATALAHLDGGAHLLRYPDVVEHVERAFEPGS